MLRSKGTGLRKTQEMLNLELNFEGDMGNELGKKTGLLNVERDLEMGIWLAPTV